MDDLQTIYDFSEQATAISDPSPVSGLSVSPSLTLDAWATLLGWAFVRHLGSAVETADVPAHSRNLLDEWLLAKVVTEALLGMGLDQGAAAYVNQRIKWLTTWQNWHSLTPAIAQSPLTFNDLLRDPDIRNYLQVNRYNDVLWYNGEAMNSVLWWLECVARLAQVEVEETMAALREVAAASGYQVEKLLAPTEPVAN